MPNLATRLTQSLCARALPEPLEYLLRDTALPGLGLRIHPSGTRNWIVRLRHNGKQTRQSLGIFPETSLKMARKMAAALLADGVRVELATAACPTFAVFQIEHGTRHARAFKPSGLRSYRSYVRNELLPAFGKLRLDTITRQDVVRWFDVYSRRSPGGANRALGILGQILTSAQAWGTLPASWRNPVSGIRPNRGRNVGSFLSEEQMARLGTVLDRRIAAGCTVAATLRFLTLTGCRLGEIVELQWRDVRTGCLHLRDSKTGPREVQLGQPAQRVLALHKRKLVRAAQARTAPVFALPGDQSAERVRSRWPAIKRQAGLPHTFRIHDLRHSFASHAVMGGETLFVTSRLLGHSQIEMTARYAHLADDALAAAAERVAGLILRQCGEVRHEL